MANVQQLLDTVNTTYRNSYSTAQKVEWMDDTQRQIFQTVRHEAVPYEFTTVSEFSFYPLPYDCDPMGVKKVDIETKAGSNRFCQLTFVNIDSGVRVSEQDEFYSITANQDIYLNPIPTDKTEGKRVFVYYNKRPASLSISNLAAFPDLEEDFHELLVLGCLMRITRARGEWDDNAGFKADYMRLLKDYQDLYAQPFPEYSVPEDRLPRRRGQVHTKGYHNRYPYGLLPTDLIKE